MRNRSLQLVKYKKSIPVQSNLSGRIKKLVAENKLDLAARLLIDSPLRNEGIIQKSRLTELMEQVRLGTIDTVNRNLEANRLRHALLEAADLLENLYTRIPIYLNEIPGETRKIIGRISELDKLSQLLEKNSFLLLKGIAGVGKTTLAKSYLSQYQFRFSHICWVRITADPMLEGKRQQTIVDALIDDFHLFESLELPFDLDLPKEERLSKLLIRLNNLPGPNLMIIDNAEKSLENIATRLPLTPNWRFLITSRFTLDFETFHLDVLSPEKAKELFYRHNPNGINHEKDIENLLKHIGYHTLTIELLAKSCQASKLNRFTPSRVLELIINHKFDSIDKEVTSSHSGRSVKVFKYLCSIFDFSSLSVEETDILCEFSVLPSKEINRNLLIKLFGYVGKDIPSTFEDCIESLVQKGWLLYFESTQTFKVHQLVQEVVRYQIPPTSEKCSHIIQGIAKLLAFDSYDSMISKYPYVAFGELLLLHIKERDEKISDLLQNIGMGYYHSGQYSQALKYLNEATQIKEQISPNSESLADSYNDISLIYVGLGNFEKALLFQFKDIQLKENLHKSGSIDFAVSYDNLAGIYFDMEDYDEAMKFGQKALAIREKFLSKDHPDLSTSYHNMAALFKLMGELSKALEFEKKSIKIGELFPENGISLAISYINLGDIHRKLGQLPEGASVIQKGIEMIEKLADSEHPYLAKSYVYMGCIQFDMKEFDSALKYFETALFLFEKLLPDEHPDIGTTKSWIEKTTNNLSAK